MKRKSTPISIHKTSVLLTYAVRVMRRSTKPRFINALWKPSKNPMTIRLLTDENFNHAIFRGLREKAPNLDIIRVHDIGLTNTDDPIILAWAAQEQRLVLTHDANTMTDFAYERVRTGQGMPGVIEISLRVPI